MYVGGGRAAGRHLRMGTERHLDLAGLDLRRYEIEERGDEFVSVFFYFEARLERRWGTGPNVKDTFGLYQIADDAEGNVQIDFEHIPAELLVHQLRGVAACEAVGPLTELALREGWHLEAETITCPVRVVWGVDDKLLAWPSAAARFRDDWLPHADWVVLDGVEDRLSRDLGG